MEKSTDHRVLAMARELGRVGGDTGPSVTAQVERLLDDAKAEGAVAAACRWFSDVLATGAFDPHAEHMAYVGADLLLFEFGKELAPPDPDFEQLIGAAREGRWGAVEAVAFQQKIRLLEPIADGR